MAGYLEEKVTGDGLVLQWQTPNRQRLWGLVAALPGAGLLAHGLYGARTMQMWEVVSGGVLMLGAFLVATWTVKFELNLKSGGYQFVRGFLPVLVGQRGPARNAFQCVAIRSERLDEVAGHEDEAATFDRYRVFMVWKQPGVEAMLVDTCPENYTESLNGRDHHAQALATANKIAGPLGLEVLDQAVVASAVAVVEMPDTVREESASS